MSVFYYSTKEKRAPGYGCVAGYVDGGPTCQMMSSAPVDAAVAELFLAAVTPAQVDVALRALDAYEAERAEARRQREMQIQRAEYEVEIARRRYEATDPANRLVAAELEVAVGAGAAGAGAAASGRPRNWTGGRPARWGRPSGGGCGRWPPTSGRCGSAATTGMEDRKELLRFPGPPGVPGRGDRGGADPDRGRVAHRAHRVR